jgi:signal peptidase I
MTEREVPVALYLGEPKARVPFLAVLLTLVCPGLGAVYLGHLLRGVLTCLAFVAVFAVFVLGWTALKFFPVLPMLVVGVSLTAAAVSLALRAGDEARSVGSRYLLRSTNHPVVYVLVAAVFYFLPLAGLAQFTGERLWSLVWVETEAMFPTLVRGDLLLVDRTAYRDHSPQPGDIVVVQPRGGGGPLRLGRIVALPGQQVSVEDAVPVIDGKALSRSVVSVMGSDPELQLAALEQVTPPLGAITVAERNGRATYLTAELPAELGVVFEPVALSGTEYFVMNDNRSLLGDSRDFGPVERRDILGQPLYVAYSSSSADGVRWGRAARRVQPPPPEP